MTSLTLRRVPVRRLPARPPFSLAFLVLIAGLLAATALYAVLAVLVVQALVGALT